MSTKKAVLTVSVSAVALALAVAVATALALWSRGARASGSGAAVPSATDQQLQSAAGVDVFFAHQSVGQNVVDGISALYPARRLPGPNIVESVEALPGGEGTFEHARIGTNGDPSGKIEEFDKIVRAGVGDRVDVAMMKLCYVDITNDTDVEALFRQYRDTLAKLQRDYPDVTFVHVTAPITTERSMAARAKALLGRGDNFPPENNAARERYNELLRQEYEDSAPVFDLAAIQSTTPDGARVEGTVDGQVYFAMDQQYARDPGHLNAEGSALAAEALMALIAAQATGR